MTSMLSKRPVSLRAMAALVVLAAICLVGLPGCGASYPQLGTKADGTIDVVIENGLEAGLKGLSVRATGTESWGERLALEEGALAVGERAELHVEPVASATSYDLLLSVDGAGDVEVWSVDLAGIRELTLHANDDGVGYVDYLRADGEKGSTLEAAKAKREADEEAERKAEEERKAAEEAARAEEERKAKEEEERKAAEEAARAEEERRRAEEEAAAAEAESYASSYYSSDSSSYGSSSSGGGSSYSAPAQSGDECSSDVIALD